MWRPLMLAFCLVGAPWLNGCAGTGINRGDVSLISVDEEWQLGQQLAGDIAREMEVIDDPAITAYVTRMGNSILAQARGESEVASLPWTFRVIRDESINAFNIPGGHVYLHSGLVAAAGDYAELMGVMAHEVSHGLARHGVENLTKQYGVGILVSLVLGQNPAAYQEILANVLAGGAVMKFSRAAENEADRLGADYMWDASVDPEGMVDFFQILLDTRSARPGALEQFFSSHPLTEDRIAAVRARIAGFPARPLIRDEAGFQEFQAAVARRAGTP